MSNSQYMNQNLNMNQVNMNALNNMNQVNPLTNMNQVNMNQVNPLNNMNQVNMNQVNALNNMNQVNMNQVNMNGMNNMNQVNMNQVNALNNMNQVNQVNGMNNVNQVNAMNQNSITGMNAMEPLTKECYNYSDYPIDVNSQLQPELRGEGPNVQVPSERPNGGIYRGPQSDKWYVPKPIPSTTTYFNQVLLRNSDPAPPPGATEQYPGNTRLGNNYVAMPGVNWYNSAYPRNNGPFSIKVMDTNSI